MGPLSRGSDGLVFRIKVRKTKKEFALKVIWKDKNKKNVEAKSKKEIAIHAMLKNKHIIILESHFEDEDNFYMVLEYCSEGDLLKYMNARGGFSLSEIRNYGLQIA
jgi:serine/threonine protein kinase